MRMLRILALALVAAVTLPVPAEAHYERGELEQLLAPVALYPDSVLSHVLIAATYPDQVAEAARWSRSHPKLQGEAAVDAVERYDWDPSVKALAAFPEVLARMDEDPDWTDEVGEAFLDHEADVMDAVQRLRKQAYDAGRLRELDHVHVVYERDYIYLEPPVHHVVYVPYYDPWWAYGTWYWTSYPPHRWRHWHGHAVSYYPAGWYWGIGFTVRPAFYFTTFYWPERYVVVNPRRDRPMYSGRYAAQQPREVRHWREQPSASRHASRDNGGWRRHSSAGAQQREPRQERSPERREERTGRNVESREERAERNVERRTERNAEREDRNERNVERREERQERNADARRERMEQGRQRRDAERGQRSESRDDRGPEPRSERQDRAVERQDRSRQADRSPRPEAQPREERGEPRAAFQEDPRGRREEARPERAPRESRGSAQREERGNGREREGRSRERRER